MLDRLRNKADIRPFLGGTVAMAENFVKDWVGTLGGLRGDDLDEWDPEYIRRALPVMAPLFNTYFRGEVRGLENIPAEGPALLVGNHSGGTMIADTFVLTMSFYEHFGPERRFHQLAHDVAARMPGLGIRPFGTVRASHENAKGAFERDALVLVYPGGDYETFRPSWHSDQIEFGGRKGFVKLAMEAGVPIVPVVAIGGQESALFVTRGQRAARLTRLDKLARIKVLPVSLGPPFGVNLLDLPLRFPLPAKITIEILPPVDLEERFGPEPDPDSVYETLTEDMQKVLSGLADERTVPVLG
ncbi:MAG: acyltransferase family protein [Solirubrobacterales bacterium]|nr:acyltransferase family protein [Solirubrobacterales bacterium]